MSLDLINTEDFISEVESRPTIWNVKSDDHSNKVLKKNAWQEIIDKFVPDFNNKSMDERNKIGKIFQRKWKSLRASYTRELLRQNIEKSGPAATGRKQYIYFEQLRFLATDCNSPTSGIDIDDDEDRNEFQGEGIVKQEAHEKSSVQTQKRQREKKSIEEEGALHNILKEKLAKTEDNSSQQTDGDTLFMQSLVPELKQIPHHARLKVKSELLNVILNAQQYYSTSASFTSSQMGVVQNWATQGQYHDPAHPGAIQGNIGGQSRLPHQLPAARSPTDSEYSDDSL